MPLPLIVILVVLATLSLLAVAGYLIDRSEERQERREAIRSTGRDVDRLRGVTGDCDCGAPLVSRSGPRFLAGAMATCTEYRQRTRRF